MADFGKNPDGSPRLFGQLSAEEQRNVLKGVCARLKTEFENPEHQRRMAAVLGWNGDTDGTA